MMQHTSMQYNGRTIRWRGGEDNGIVNSTWEKKEGARGKRSLVVYCVEASSTCNCFRTAISLLSQSSLQKQYCPPLSAHHYLSDRYDHQGPR